jgi:DNA primase
MRQGNPAGVLRTTIAAPQLPLVLCLYVEKETEPEDLIAADFDDRLAMYPREFVDRVRRAADLLELASEVTQLRPRGSQYYGRCPFHEETTPSFAIDRERRVYHCFGCGAGGDALDFYRRSTGATFPEALRALAGRYRIPLPLPAKNPPDRLPLLEALAAATDYYVECLKRPDGAKARAYLERRRIPPAVADAYRIGYAPPAWRGCLEALSGRFAVEALQASGLVRRSKSGRGLIDTFRDRILFPIADESGNVLAFAGRALVDGSRSPTYANTPNTSAFRKGTCLFGWPQAMPTLRKSRRVFLVEGYFDVLAMAASSAGPALGLMGTALRPEQAGTLARRVREVVLLLDGDRAGREAAFAIAPALLRAQLSVLLAHLPDGADPASLREDEGDAALLSACESADDVIWDALRRFSVADDLTEETKAIESLLTLIGAMPDPALRLAYSRRTARTLELPLKDLLAILPHSG